MKLFSLILTSSLILMSCTNKNESLTKDDEAFAKIYADVLLVTASLEQSKSESGKKLDSLAYSQAKSDSLNLVFNVHQITAEIFYNKVNDYLENPKRWQKIQERTAELLEQRRK